MAKVNKGARKSDSLRHRVTPYPLGSCCSKGLKDVHKNKKQTATALDKKEWEDAICSVCLEFPHNAVLLLCSSYRKGCRPYMCATSDRYSNCLDQFKKAYTKVSSNTSRFPWDGTMEYSDLSLGVEWSGEDVEVLELLCPLCRGQVKGWTVVEPARECLNKKKRTCMQDTCSFLGTYKQLRKHVKAEHPRGRPREVDPSVVEKWKKLENETEENDVMSTILSTMPGAVVVGDYVIDRRDGRRFSRNYDGDDCLDMDDVYSALEESYRGGGYDHDDSYPQEMFEAGYQSWDDQDDGGIYRYDSRVRSGRVNNYVTGLGRRHGRASTARSGPQQRRRGAGNRHIYFT